jgi:hypothetical protein
VGDVARVRAGTPEREEPEAMAIVSAVSRQWLHASVRHFLLAAETFAIASPIARAVRVEKMGSAVPCWILIAGRVTDLYLVITSFLR